MAELRNFDPGALTVCWFRCQRPNSAPRVPVWQADCLCSRQHRPSSTFIVTARNRQLIPPAFLRSPFLGDGTTAAREALYTRSNLSLTLPGQPCGRGPGGGGGGPVGAGWWGVEGRGEEALFFGF